MTARCPECGEDVIVGTAGPAGLCQHTGKSKCKKNVERKKKQEKEGKMRTLFNIGVKKVNVVPQEPAMPEASSSLRALPLPIIDASSIHREGVPAMMLYKLQLEGM